jgi:hypothetical protein
VSTVVGMTETASAWCECVNVAVFRTVWGEMRDWACDGSAGREVDERRQRCVCDRTATEGLIECLSRVNASLDGALGTILDAEVCSRTA